VMETFWVIAESALKISLLFTSKVFAHITMRIQNRENGTAKEILNWHEHVSNSNRNLRRAKKNYYKKSCWPSHKKNYTLFLYLRKFAIHFYFSNVSHYAGCHVMSFTRISFLSFICSCMWNKKSPFPVFVSFRNYSLSRNIMCIWIIFFLHHRQQQQWYANAQNSFMSSREL
jgi:hypothetical protein